MMCSPELVGPRLVAQDFSPADPAGRAGLKTCATAVIIDERHD
jgi:hypothetical protein